MRKWGIKQSTSSPGFAQSNGQSERFIQTIKRMMKKADDDIFLALLENRNTILVGTDLNEQDSEIQDTSHQAAAQTSNSRSQNTVDATEAETESIMTDH